MSCCLLGRRVAVWGLLACGLLSPMSAWAQGEDSSVIPVRRAAGGNLGIGIEIRSEGDSSRRTRNAAQEQIPVAQLTPAGQQSVRAILGDISLFRRLPTVEIDADRRIYDYFTQHPDVAVSLWRAMDISSVQMWQSGPDQYRTDTRDGTNGVVDVLLRRPDHYLIVCQGNFQSPALRKPIQASALMHLQPAYLENGKIVHTVDLFVSFPSQTVETVARLISPVSNRIADRNLEEVSLFVEMMSAAMQTQPGWVNVLTQRLDGVQAERPQELRNVTAAIYQDAEQRRAMARGGAVEAPQPLPVQAIQQTSLVPPPPQ